MGWTLSLSLLTPDAFRPGGGKKAKFLWEQKAAWQTVCDAQGHCQRNVRGDDGSDHVVTVKPKVMQFNFGVNEFSQGGAFSVFFLGGWGNSNPVTSEWLHI